MKLFNLDKMLQHAKRFFKPITKHGLVALLFFSITSSATINNCKALSGTHSTKVVLWVDTVYTTVDKAPVFPGGMPAFIKYLAKNVRYPEAMRERGVEGIVIAQFVVEPDGAITTIRILDGPGWGSSEETIRLLKKSPKWQPGYNNGKSVRVLFKVPVDFSEKNFPPDGNKGFKLINGG